MTRRRWHADLALAGVALIWGATFVLVKNALADVSTVLFLALRFTLAALALAVVFRAGTDRAQLRKNLKGGLIAGFFLITGYLLQTFGLELTTPSKSAFITGLYIVLVPLIGAIVYQRAPRIAEAVGVAVATVGMGLLSVEKSGMQISRGDLLTLGCAIAFAVHILVLGEYSRPGNHQALALLQVATSAGIALLAFWWAETPRLKWSPAVISALAITSLLATALAFTVQTWAQQHTTPTRTALIFTLEPVFAWMTSFLVLGEVLSGRALAGALLILSGILIVELKPASPEAHPSKQLRSD